MESCLTGQPRGEDLSGLKDEPRGMEEASRSRGREKVCDELVGAFGRDGMRFRGLIFDIHELELCSGCGDVVVAADEDAVVGGA